jgi:hypothetical protein
MDVRLTKCQLGLFGYASRKSIVKAAGYVAKALEQAIRKALVNDRLPCDRAWEIADTCGMHKMEVSAACDALEIKIRPCQLGAF